MKQAIYRWRNSDWRILGGQIGADFAHQQVEVQDLKVNHRSLERVIRFNNTVFQLAAGLLADRMEEEGRDGGLGREVLAAEVRRFREAYADAVQDIPGDSADPDPTGYVQVDVFPEGTLSEFREQTLDALAVWLDQILEAGYRPGDIAILVRNKREGALVATALLELARLHRDEERYRFITNDSLILVQNDAVNLILAMLRYLVDPGHGVNVALCKHLLLRYGVQPSGEEADGSDRVYDRERGLEDFLPEALRSGEEALRHLPLYELIEHLIRALGLDQQADDLPYLQALQNLVVDLSRGQHQEISGFLDYMDRRGHTHSLTVTEHTDAIQILTIHKSKGLQFEAVLVPFCNWELTTDGSKGTILWCRTAGTPFHRMPLVPLNYGNDLKDSMFSGDYLRERMQGYMDNLNLLYVAFTRARSLLFVGVPGNDGQRMRHTGDLLLGILPLRPERQPAFDNLGDFRTNGGLRIGNLPEPSVKKAAVPGWTLDRYPVVRDEGIPRIRIRNDLYFVDEEEDASGTSYGNIMHEIFAGIRYIGDESPVLEEMVRKGLVKSDHAAMLMKRIRGWLARVADRNWFVPAEGRQVFVERSLVDGEGRVFRPDRVVVDGAEVRVIDFKFGRTEKEEYRRQMARYRDILKAMGYGSVRTFLWYVLLDKVVDGEPWGGGAEAGFMEEPKKGGGR
ncbi:MAG: 3'-5' exonuclease [Bacteroidales bacterium]